MVFLIKLDLYLACRNKMLKAQHIKNGIEDFLHLFYPSNCFACEDVLYRGEKAICTTCYYKLPLCNFEDPLNNEMAKKFWGKIKFEGAFAYLNFIRKGRTQSLMHRLKYKGEKSIGVLLGELMAEDLAKKFGLDTIDFIVPVPLHRKKLIKRGFNQSACIAEGMAKVLNIPVETGLVKRVIHSDTQTKKKRFERWQNVGHIFELNKTRVAESKHILVVDDITTTGSTLSACAEQLLLIPGSKVSLASLAYAN